MSDYRASNWYWIVGGDETKVWSSASVAYELAAAAGYQAFLAAGGAPTCIGSEGELRDVLAQQYPQGWPGGDLVDRLSQGIAITSDGTPALDATYALDQTTLDQIGSVARDSFNLGLPGGLSAFTYPDIAGAPRTFAAADVQHLYKAMRDLVFSLNQTAAALASGQTATWPSHSATIA